MFVDRALITVRAGNGGNGSVSFRREAGAPKGGPDGGNGGDGGSVLLVAEDGIHTLYDFRGRPDWPAQHGAPGTAKQCSGLAGADCIVRLPAGTLIYNADTGELIHDLKPRERIVVAKGGRGGFGNEHFKTSTNQSPREAEPGEPGERFHLRLELKLIADVGLVGLPNAGKSTLLAAVTRAKPKVGDYPFTTLSPQLGIAELDATRRVVLADIPGLIEGAAGGAGLGHDFLRHIERTRVIVHLLDAAPLDGSHPAANYRMIRDELAAYSPELADKQEVIALNKLDLLPTEEERREAVRSFRADLNLGAREPIFPISGATGEGTRALLEHLWGLLTPAGKEPVGWKAEA